MSGSGFYSEVHRLSAESSQEEVLALVDKLNEQESIHGILVQLPLPKHIHEKAVIDAIAVERTWTVSIQLMWVTS